MVANILLLAQGVQVDTTSVVSVGVLVVVLGATWRLSSLLSQINERLREALENIRELKPIPEKLSLLEQRVTRVEGEILEMWDMHRKAS